jgi:hypothetical protein
MMDGKVIVVRSDQSNHCEGECQLVPEKNLNFIRDQQMIIAIRQEIIIIK